MIKKIKDFIFASLYEIRYKVTWSSYKALWNNSALVLLASVVFAVIVGLIDFFLKNLITWVYTIF